MTRSDVAIHRPGAPFTLAVVAALALALASTAPSATNALEAGLGVGRGNRVGSEPAETPAADSHEPRSMLASAGTAPAASIALPVPMTYTPPPPGRIAATYTVTTTADTGAGSLAAAIAAANATPELDFISFAIPGGGVQTLYPKGPITLTQPVIFDATTQPGWSGSPLIELDGSLAGPNANGIVVTGGFSTVSGFIINRYKTTGSGGYGILLDTNGFNTITGCWIGTNATGTGRVGNAIGGIVVLGASGDNVIGGTTTPTRNVISGNPGSGIHLATGNVGRNIIRGNWIGLSATGDTLANGGNGIFLNSPNNVIGGTIAGARNVISGNGYPGIWIGFAATATIIQGNYIGTDPTGALDRGNLQNGINLDQANNCVIGGNTPAARNVISGNDFPGVYVFGPATGNKIQGNYIGTNAGGTIGLGDGNAIVIDNAANNQIGGGGAGEGNLISGHPFTAVVIQNAGATGNTVRGNLIGTNAAGNASVPNTRGVIVANANRNVIGGSAPGEGNIVSGNDVHGIELRNAHLCRVSGNKVGTDATGVLDLGNKQHGIVIIASTDTIGGTSDAFANVVAFNRMAGIYDSTGAQNLIRFNKTYGNGALGIDLFPRGIVANDSLDGDSGANFGQNFPILDSTSVASGTTHVFGRLDSQPSTSYTLDFFYSTESDTAHFGEGRAHFTSLGVNTDAAGRASFDLDVGSLVPDHLFITATATDPTGSTSEFSQTLCLADRDKDGIRDCWETPGWPVDIDSDGKYELDLYARGARPDSIDIFVEIDAMSGYAPPAGMVPMVKAAFSGLPKEYLFAAPEVNGVALHAELSHQAISDFSPNFPDLWPSFRAVRNKYFGNANEIADPNSAKILRAKSRFFRYGIWARTFGAGADTTWSGYGEGSSGSGGDEFLVTFGSTGPNGWNSNSDLRVHAGTFMHELGHTLGLKHGGSDDLQYKPNYYSIMNYTWQTPKIWQWPGTWRLDYSRWALPALNENNLNENAGLGAPAGVWPVTDMPFSDSTRFTWYAQLKPGAKADWTGDSNYLANRQVDINLLGDTTATPGQTLTSYQDWRNLVVNFRHSPEYTPAGMTPEERSVLGEPEPLQSELTPAILEQLNSIPPPRPEGIFVMDGQRDPNSALVASNAGVNLYAAYRTGPLGGQLYLAAEGAQADRDVAILVAKTPGAMRSAPLGKSGSVAAWDALLARRGTAAAAEWQDETGTPFDQIVVDSAGTFLEGVVRLEALLGEEPETYSLALAAYGAAPGGALVAQAPGGNGNGDVEAGEWLTLGTSLVDVPGVPGAGLGLGVRLTNARPNPSTGISSVRLSLPAAADVVATVQDVAGRTVATLVRARMEGGDHVIRWDGLADGARKPGAGVYFLVVRALGEQRTARVVLLP